MSLPRFFLTEQVLAEQIEPVFALRLDADDAKHARVLRLKPGEHIAVVDAAQDYFECEIVAFDDAVPAVRISRHHTTGAYRPTVVLVQGLAKGDKMETVIRHATELGVAGFIPVAFKRSILKLEAKRAASKAARWRSIAKSAAMQSGQPAIPEVHEPMDLSRACELLGEATAVLVCWEEARQAGALSQVLASACEACSCADPRDARIAVVVGPEGGITDDEVELLLSCNPRASLVTLGPSILRTETAGVVAPALVLYELGALGPHVGGGERA
ncbi:MAG: RsmE family RNA methyltransferase [Eggerthellaceae bacterium]|nr:RsmE family RNA methyltransferase [Eggerthellaceae bacterium]